MAINQEEVRVKLEGLRARLSIDPTKLEIECVSQAILYEEIGELATEFQASAKEAKDHLDFVRAEKATAIRKKPGDYGVEKVTEGSIESAVILTPEYQQASKELIDAEKVLGFMRVLQTSAEQRKPMLNNLVTLFVHQYYSREQDMAGERGALNKTVENDVLKERQRKANEQNNTQEGQETEG